MSSDTNNGPLPSNLVALPDTGSRTIVDHEFVFERQNGQWWVFSEFSPPLPDCFKRIETPFPPQAALFPPHYPGSFLTYTLVNRNTDADISLRMINGVGFADVSNRVLAKPPQVSLFIILEDRCLLLPDKS